MRFRLLTLLAVAVAAAVAAISGIAFAGADHLSHKTINASNCAGTGTLVVNVQYGFINDPDSAVGLSTAWANDTISRVLKVWDLGPSATAAGDDFCITVSDTGTFVTTGNSTPEGTQSTDTLTAGITGNIQGGYVATATGTLNASPDYASSGSLGVFDLNLTGSPAHPSFLSYIDLTNGWAYTDWGWIYKTASNGTWINQDSNMGGNVGNITSG